MQSQNGTSTRLSGVSCSSLALKWIVPKVEILYSLTVQQEPLQQENFDCRKSLKEQYLVKI